MARVKRGEGKERIEQAALALFAERGFDGATTSAIAKRAGVAEGTIFRHFKTKKALLLGLLAPMFERMVPMVARGVFGIFDKEHPNLESFLHELMVDRLNFAEKASVLLRVMVQEYAIQQELRETVHRVFSERVLPAFRGKIERLQAAGHVAEELPTLEVVQVILTAFGGYGLARYALLPEAEWNDKAHRATILRVLTKGLAP